MKWIELLRKGFNLFLDWCTFSQRGPIRKGKFYKRTGECNQCGQCCQNIYLFEGRHVIKTVREFERLQRQYSDFRHFEPISQEDEAIQFRCKNLGADNRCQIYEDRPLLCRSYPSEQSLLNGGILHSDCSYQFELLRTFQEVLSVSQPGQLTAEPLQPAMLASVPESLKTPEPVEC